MRFGYFPEPSLYPPEPELRGHCDHCGDEIYAGETVYRVDGKVIHADCMEDFEADGNDISLARQEEVESYAGARLW